MKTRRTGEIKATQGMRANYFKWKLATVKELIICIETTPHPSQMAQKLFQLQCTRAAHERPFQSPANSIGAQQIKVLLKTGIMEEVFVSWLNRPLRIIYHRKILHCLCINHLDAIYFAKRIYIYIASKCTRTEWPKFIDTNYDMEFENYRHKFLFRLASGCSYANKVVIFARAICNSSNFHVHH